MCVCVCDNVCVCVYACVYVCYVILFFESGDAWSFVVRPIAIERNSLESSLVQMFFVSYMLIVSVVLINCVIAVLLGATISLFFLRDVVVVRPVVSVPILLRLSSESMTG